MLTIDGARGEGGGQVLRASLALSLVTGTPVRLKNVRANRRKPGLAEAHVACVDAARQVGKAEVQGAAVGSQDLVFRPRGLAGGSFRFDAGAAGSVSSLFQIVLPALLSLPRPSAVLLEGATHSPFAPPYEFLQQVYLPLLERMGARIDLRLVEAGFAPAGGGCLQASIRPCAKLQPLELLKRGKQKSLRATAVVSNLPAHIAGRELRVVEGKLKIPRDDCRVRVVTSRGPGNAVVVESESENVTEVFSSFGRKGVKPEKVASEACEQTRRYLRARVPVGPYLADQLLLPLALAGGGRIRTLEPTAHTRASAQVIRDFLGIEFGMRKLADGAWDIWVGV